MSYYTFTEPKRDYFSLFVGLSLSIHLIFFLFVMLKLNFFPADEDLIIKGAMKVDLVALPEKKPPKVGKKKPKKKTKKVSLKKKTDLKKTKQAQKSAIEKLRQKSAIADIKKMMEEQEEPDQEVIEEESTVNKGNILTEGTQFGGLDQIQYERYYSDITAHVKKYWALPQWLAAADYKAHAAVRIDRRGYVIESQIYESSNNSVFDNIVLKTVKDASPFPAPPPRMVSKIVGNTFVISFP